MMNKPSAIVTGASGIVLELAAICAQEGRDNEPGSGCETGS